MLEIKSQFKGVTDRQKWRARGASFVAKAKATKAVWFPPKPVETVTKAAAPAKEATKKTTNATKKSTRSTKKKTTGAAKKSTGAAKKTASSTKKVTDPVRRKKA